VEVNPLSKKELKFSTYRKVPVLIVDGEQLNDSSYIIKALSAKLPKNRAKQSAAAAAEEEEWFSWVDGRFVHVLTPNIYRTLGESMQTFDYITKTGNFGWMDRELARWSGVAIMVRPSLPQAPLSLACQYALTHTRLKKRHNITDERQALYTEVRRGVMSAWCFFPCSPSASSIAATAPFLTFHADWQVDRRAGHPKVHGRRVAQPGRHRAVWRATGGEGV